MRYYVYSLLIAIWLTLLWFSKIDSFGTQTAIGLSLICLTLAYFMSTYLHRIIGLAYAYFSVLTIVKIAFCKYFWSDFDLPTIVAMESLVTSALFYGTAILVTFMLLDLNKIFPLFIIFCCIDVWVILGKKLFGMDPWFLFNNPAMDAAFISCMIPLILDRLLGYKRLLIVPLIAVCFITDSSTGVMGVGVSIGAYYGIQWLYKYGVNATGSIVTGCALVVSCIGYLMQGDILFHSSGRTYIWKASWEFFKKYINPWFGSGLGTFQLYGVIVEISTSVENNIRQRIEGFFWMHNDWLQILFESGVIGLILVLVVYAMAVWKVRRHPALFASIITFGSIAIIQMPLRFVLFASLGAYLLVSAFRTPKETSSTKN